MSKHLTVEQRYAIFAMTQKSYTQKDIAEAIGVSKSTISRELKRNCDKRSGKYIMDLAQRKADERKQNKVHFQRFTEPMQRKVKKLLKADLSPEQIAGRYKLEGKVMVSHETIYQWIWENLRVFRFFYNHGRFRHQMTNLGVMNSSRYYQDIKDNSHDFKQIDTVELLPKDYVTLGELNNCCITEKICFVEKNTWAHFSLVEAYYLKAHYMYKLYGKDKSFVYQEFLNDEMINALEIEYNSIEYVILKKSNESVLLFNDLLKLVKSTAKDTITDCEIYNILEELKREGLIYTPYDYSEIVSIIDIDSII